MKILTLLYIFFYGKCNDFGVQIKNFTKLTGDPLLFIIDLPSEKKNMLHLCTNQPKKRILSTFWKDGNKKTLTALGLDEPVKGLEDKPEGEEGQKEEDE